MEEVLEKIETADFNITMGLSQGNINRLNKAKKRRLELEQELLRLKSRVPTVVTIPINYTRKNRNKRSSFNNTNTTRTSFAPQTVRRKSFPPQTRKNRRSRNRKNRSRNRL